MMLSGFAKNKYFTTDFVLDVIAGRQLGLFPLTNRTHVGYQVKWREEGADWMKQKQ